MITEKGKSFIFKKLLPVVLILGTLGAVRVAGTHGYGRKIIPSFLLPKVALDTTDTHSTASVGNIAFAGLPSKTPVNIPGAPQVRIQWWAWNAQTGCQYAN